MPFHTPKKIDWFVPSLILIVSVHESINSKSWIFVNAWEKKTAISGF